MAQQNQSPEVTDEERIAALRGFSSDLETDGHNAEAEIVNNAADRLEALTKENFTLAANQCSAGYGDEYGNHRCRHEDAARALTEEDDDLWPFGRCPEAYDHGGDPDDAEDVSEKLERFDREIQSELAAPQPAQPDFERFDLGFSEDNMPHMVEAPEGDWCFYPDARAHITALTAKVGELESILATEADHAGEWKQHCKTAEARVAQLEEALQFTADLHAHSRPDDIQEAIDASRAALASAGYVIISTTDAGKAKQRELTDAVISFEDFINEPPQYEDQRMVRDYRHELYRKWKPLCRMIRAVLGGQSNG